MPRVKWSPIMDEYLFRCRMRGESFTSIAASLGVTRRSAHARFGRKFSGIVPPEMVRRLTCHHPDTKAAIIRMRLSGKRLKEIAAETGLNVNQVHGIWWHWNNYLFVRERAA